MKKMLLVILAITLVGGGGYFVYTTALAAGQTAGQDKGYTTGYAAGQETGSATGYTTGYNKGKAEGSTAGKQEGYDAGYKAGVAMAGGNPFKLHNPTYAEVKDFLAQDKTDQVPYNELTYVCTHYARDVINHAVDKGIRTAYVEIRHPGIGHSIVAFDTIDKGIVYFEPQYDSEVRPALGKKLWQCMLPKDDGTTFSAPNYDDTINDVLIIW